jgi:hypothetical protein
MSLNKKQKKQIEVERKKIVQLRVLLNAARLQPDDPGDIQRIEKEIADCEARIKKAQQEEA